MENNLPFMNSGISSAIEITFYLSAAALAFTLTSIGAISLPVCIWCTTIILLTIFYSSWRSFDGGRHPCFLFLGLLLLFQGGRLIAFVLGALQNPMQIDVATVLPVKVTPTVAELTLFILTISAILIYAPCRMWFRPITLSYPVKLKWLEGLYVFVFVTFPFALYKNIDYFNFIHSHGGYLAVYTDNSAVLQSAGTVVRTISLLNLTAIIILFVLERRPKKLSLILALYFSLSLLDLLIGFRGKFFSEALGLWFIHKLKTGKRFHLFPLIITALVVSIISVSIASFRGDTGSHLLDPITFIGIQGVSLNVTEAAVAFRDTFARYGANYVWWGFITNIDPIHADTAHKLWTNDLTAYLNPEAARLGFGTASSYLAELFLWGGVLAVVLGSLGIGFILRALHALSERTCGAILLAVVLPPMIYLPRIELLAPVSVLIKSAISIVPIALFVACYNFSIGFLRPRLASTIRPSLD